MAVKSVQAVSEPQAAERGHDNWAHALFDGIDDAVFVHDLQGRILEANPAACQRLGYTRDEILHLHTSDIDAPEFAEGFGERLRQQLTAGGFRCEGRHRTKDGRVIPVDINTSAIVVDGKPAVLAVMRDITERKRAEEALRKQTELLESILANMADAVLVADDHGRVLTFNPAAERLLGVGDADKGSAEWQKRYRVFLPDKVTPCPHHEMPLTRAIRGEQVNDMEVFLRHEHVPRGHWLSVSGGGLRDGRGSVKGGVIVCRDVTARKRAERRLAAQYAVTRALDDDTPEEAAPDVLQALCVGLGWDLAALWVKREGSGVLGCAGVWHRPGLPVEGFAAATRAAAFFPGEDLPGRVWATGRETWVADLAADDNFSRLPAAQAAGLGAAFAFPASSGGTTVGVVEGFSRGMDRPDVDALSMTAALGSQIGHVLERQRVEKALRESEAFYHSLVESLPQNIFRKDLEGRVTFGNQRYCALLGRPLEQLIGRTDYDLFPAELAAKYRADDHRVQESGVPLELVEEHVLPGGQKIYVQVIKTPIRDDQSKVIGTQGMFWDVTERKRAEMAVAASERRYRQLTEATLDAIVLADREGRVTLFNPAAECIFGYAAAEVVGQPLELLMPPEYREQHLEGFTRYLRTGVAQLVGKTVELHGRRKDGTTFPVELALSVVEGGGADGPEVQFLGAIRDLTERNRIRAVLIQNEKLASIGLLSAGVAHEINNPLAFVGNNLAVLERDLKGLMELLDLYQGASEPLARVAPETAARAADLAEQVDLDYVRANLPRLLSRTRDGVDRVTRIVHSLRGLARTEPPRKQETHLPDLVEASLEMIRGRLRRRGVEVELDYDPSPRVNCVSTQLSQVLLNLLVNALQALEEHPPQGQPPRIRVRTRRLGDDMVIEVADNGPGIDPTIRERIFDPFFTTKDVGEGTGLGLSICHNIVTGHGGRIEVDSRPGAGTCFRVTLPLYPARDAS
jgi:PAS domain S-box-containing protein